MLATFLVCTSAMLFTSCADGYEDDPAFESDVRNTQLVSPELGKSCFTTVSTSSGDKLQLTWPLIKGAGGYKVNVGIVNGDDYQALITDSIIDGLSVLFNKEEDTNYKISVLTLGNSKLSNSEAKEASIFNYSTMVDGVVIPADQEISAFVKTYLTDHAEEIQAAIADDPNNYQVGFNLEGGKTYELNDSASFGLIPVTIQCTDKANKATVMVGEKGYLTTQAGLKVKYINFDCTDMEALALIMLGKTPDQSLSTEALGYKAKGGTQDCYVIEKPIVVQGCMAKNIKHGVICNNTQPWALNELRINDCLLQFVNEDTNPIINMYGTGSGAGKGGIKNITLQNTSFVNLKDNAQNYFMRFSNGSNAVPKKIWGTGETGDCIIKNCTFVKTMSNKDFANNYGNSGAIHTLKWTSNVFYDTALLQKGVRNNNVEFTAENNTIWGVTRAVDTTDAAKYATEEDPGFTTPTEAVDLTKKNGGYNLTPTGSIAAAGKYGDSRWY